MKIQPIILVTTALLFVGGGLVFLNWIPPILLLLLPLFAIGLYRVAQQKTGWLEAVIWAATLLLGFFIAIYRPADFSYPQIWQFGALYSGGAEFTLYLNTAKAIGGYLVLVWLITAISQDKVMPLLLSLLIALGGIVLVMSVAMAMGLSFTPKFPAGFAYFALVNLFVTVVAEEAFFRLLLQDRLALMMGHSRIAIAVAVGITAVIFTLAHTTKVGPAFFLFLWAGLVYGAVYAITKRFSAALVVHFGTNVCHFLLLEYPLPARLLHF